MGCDDNPLCEYKSTRFIRVRNPKLVCIYYSVIVFVLLYVVFYTIYWDYGYQKYDTVVGTSSAKLKGTGSIGNISDYRQSSVYDAMDLVVPPNEENAFFIATSQIITPNQTRQDCLGNSDTGGCTSTSNNCTANEFNADSQGILTGECGENNHCRVMAWCPLEDDSNPEIVNNVGNFTAFIKIDIEFPLYKKTRSNTIDRNGNGAPISGYNLWTINQLLSEATDGEVTDYTEVATSGAILLITSEWNCDLNYAMSHCNPKFKFSRIDGQSNSISNGFNFRTVNYDTTADYRLLRKLVGIRVILVTDGQGGKFDIPTLTLTFGAGLAYLSVAKIITDYVLENFLPNSSKYERVKNQMVDTEAFLSGDSYHSKLRNQQRNGAGKDLLTRDDGSVNSFDQPGVKDLAVGEMNNNNRI